MNNKNNKKSLAIIDKNYDWYDRKGFAGTKSADVKGFNDNSPRVLNGMWFKNKRVQVEFYTNPKFRGKGDHYQWRLVNSFDVSFDENVRRSSFVPYIIHEGKRWWLLGSFHDIPEIKTDFGGACEQTENGIEDPVVCALRETREETIGTLNTYIHDALLQGNYTIYKGKNVSNNKKYRNRVQFITVVNVTKNNNYGLALDDIYKIRFEITMKTKELRKSQDDKLELDQKFGFLNFYKEADIIRGKDSRNNEPIWTTLYLADFINGIFRKR